MRLITKVIIGCCILGACEAESRGYRAEVGYYEGREEKWHIGPPTSRAACTDEAIGMFNRLNWESQGRAFSWARLTVSIWDPNRFIGRVR